VYVIVIGKDSVGFRQRVGVELSTHEIRQWWYIYDKTKVYK
jgi:hypothetical protein